MHPDRKVTVNYAAIPHAIFSSPQVAGVGFTEQELKREAEEGHGNRRIDYVNSFILTSILLRD
jgi:pyruvate/2-oxoglutarate dehydrogenase complex dihydrolipoamide dehydrogenase (E3) component